MQRHLKAGISCVRPVCVRATRWVAPTPQRGFLRASIAGHSQCRVPIADPRFLVNLPLFPGWPHGTSHQANGEERWAGHTGGTGEKMPKRTQRQTQTNLSKRTCIRQPSFPLTPITETRRWTGLSGRRGFLRRWTHKICQNEPAGPFWLPNYWGLGGLPSPFAPITETRGGWHGARNERSDGRGS